MRASQPDDEEFEVVESRRRNSSKARPIPDPDAARRKKRKAEPSMNPMQLLVIGASVGCFVAVTAGIVGFIVYQNKKVPPPVVVAKPAPAPVADKPAEPEKAAPEPPKGPKIPTWVWFEIPDSKYYAAFPNRKPDRIPSPLDNNENPLGLGLIESTRWGLTDDARNYALTILKLPNELTILGMTSEALLETVMSDRSKILVTEGGRVQSTTPGNLRGVQFHHLEVSKSTGTALIRVYAVGTALYALKVEAKDLAKDDRIAIDFLSSFRQAEQK